MFRKYNSSESGIETKKETYVLLVRYCQEHGYPPTMEELAEEMMVNTTTVRRHIKELMDDGLVETDHPGGARALRLTKFEFRRKAR